ncbi:MAG TPA: MOSC domain-containing protein [Acidimicrobiia bacterium]|nr:MOSC domain-containing protein [Acidimicrobiia bacterium]
MRHFTISELEAGIDRVLDAPAESGVLSLIVRRPSEDEREVLEVGQLDLTEGLRGDSWRLQTASAEGVRDPYNQINVMSARAISLIAGEPERWQLAGDQLYLDFDISQDNLPAGSHLAIGETVIEVSAMPHTGCQKFSQRFGVDALRFVNSEAGRKLRLRGFNARVIVPGTIRTGDPVRRQA